jgi:hypothetical protein
LNIQKPIGKDLSGRNSSISSLKLLKSTSRPTTAGVGYAEGESSSCRFFSCSDASSLFSAMIEPGAVSMAIR